jgi:dihydroorotase (multifunctional complex type)
MDLVITNGEIVRPSGIRREDVGIEDGRIAYLGPPGQAPAASRALDVRGLLILPGLVDPHVHMRDPGATHKEDFASGTRAAAAGGFTTVLCMPNVTPPVLDEAGFEASLAAGEARAVVDFGIQAAVGPGNLGSIPALWRRGITSFEIFMADAPEALCLEGSADLYEAFRMIHHCGGIAGVFPGDQSLVTHALCRFRAAGRTDWRAPAEARPPFTEALGISRGLLLAQAAGARMYLRQVSTREGVLLLRAAKADRPGAVFGEVTPHHLFLTTEALLKHGAFAYMLPPLRGQEHLAALWEGLTAGVLDAIGSDHAPHAPGEKADRRDDPWSAPPGTPGLETTLPLLLDAAHRDRITLPRVAAVCAEAPARIFGIYPRKGALVLGSDADIVLVDSNREVIVQGGRLHTKARSSPFEGWRLRGAPAMTIVRGHVVMEDGRIADAPPAGQFVLGPGAQPPP